MTLISLLRIKDILANIIDGDTDNSLNAAFKFKLLRIVATIDPVAKTYEDVKNQKIMQYGTADEEGNVSIAPNTPEHENFVKDITEVLNDEVDLTLPKLKAEDVFKYFKTNSLVDLIDIIEE